MKSFVKYALIGIIRFILFMILWSVCFRLFATWDQWRKNQDIDYPKSIQVYDYLNLKVEPIKLKNKWAESEIFNFAREGCERGRNLVFCTEKIADKEYRVLVENTAVNDYYIRQEYLIKPAGILAIKRYFFSPGHAFTVLIPALVIWWFIKIIFTKMVKRKYLILSNKK